MPRSDNPRLYHVWFSMVRRCHNPRSTDFQTYGGRGISVCPAWRNSMTTFFAWAILNGWQPGLEIDRKESNGNYEPDNCRFVTHKENMRNRRVCRMMTAFGETKTVADWADDERSQVSANTFRARIFDGWPVEEALTTPLKPKTAKRIKRKLNSVA